MCLMNRWKCKEISLSLVAPPADIGGRGRTAILPLAVTFRVRSARKPKCHQDIAERQRVPHSHAQTPRGRSPLDCLLPGRRAGYLPWHPTEAVPAFPGFLQRLHLSFLSPPKADPSLKGSLRIFTSGCHLARTM